MPEKTFTKDQLHILHNCEAGADLASDIAHARVTIYLPGIDDKSFYIYAQSKPSTQFITHAVNMTGRTVRRVEEPLVDKCYTTGVVVRGKREWGLGEFANTEIYPLFDNRHHVFAVVGFAGGSGREDDISEHIFASAAMQFLLGINPAKMQGNDNYKRLSSNDGVMIIDKDMRILAANNNVKHIFSIFGFTDIIGKRVNGPKFSWPLIGMTLQTGIAESKEMTEQGLRLLLRVIPVVSNPEADLAIAVLTDVTALREKEEELHIQSVIIKEIHHRVKNNLQTIASLLRLQARRTDSKEAKVILRDAINRVNSIATVHESLSKQDAGEIDLSAVIKDIYHGVLTSMVAPDLHLETNFDVDKTIISSDKATSVALILNELLQNSIDHGFSGRSH
ncbi:MAG: sensor histidine kinase, partial [Acidaminococcaceae bacterium]|nr:sensor histidine kinase [Acidaminococcaceae bacterium]